MSITLGVYDLFAFMIPGILYTYIANEFLKLFGLAHLDIQQINDLVPIVLVIMIGYILGQVLELPARAWRRWRLNLDAAANAIEKIKKNHPNAKIDFLPQDWPFLYGVIRRYHIGSVAAIDRLSAISIMLQNISFGLLLYALFHLISILVTGYSIDHLVFVLSAFLLALPTKRKSQIYNQWFYNSIYELSLSHGSSADKIIKKLQASKPTENL